MTNSNGSGTNGSGINGSGHHHDDEEDKPSNVTQFPDARARADAAKLKAANDAAARRAKHEPILNVPPTVKALCLLLIVIHGVLDSLEYLHKYIPAIPENAKERVYELFWFMPLQYTGGAPLTLNAYLGPITYMFLHAGWLHLAVNVGTLLAFGAGLEKEIGGKKLLLLFVASSIIGAFTHLAIYPHGIAPLIGASGGISGLFGGVLMMAHQRGLMGQGYRRLAPFVAVWIIITLFFGFFGMPGTTSAIAWTTHLGGFIAGLLLYKPVARLKF